MNLILPLKSWAGDVTAPWGGDKGRTFLVKRADTGYGEDEIRLVVPLHLETGSCYDETIHLLFI